MRKSNYYFLAKFVPSEKIKDEVIEKLDRITEVAESANAL